MKKIYVMITVAVLSIATFSSCNKNKKEIKKSDQEVADLQSQNTALQNQLTTTNGTLGALTNAMGTNEPYIINFATTNTSNVAVTFKDTLLFSARNSYYEYMNDNGNGTYDVAIVRVGNPIMIGGLLESATGSMKFTYNPTSKVITNAQCSIAYYDQHKNNLSFSFNASHAGTSISITVNSFDYSTGKISANVSASTNSTSGDNYYNNEPMTATMSFNGMITPTN